MALSIRPSTESRTIRTPVQTMLAATSSATPGSSHRQPVSATRAHADHHTGRGPDVGQQVMRVGLQRDRVVALRGPQQDQGDAQVDERGDDRDAQPQADLLQRPRMEEPVDRRHRDADGGDHDERALDPAGEVLRLAVAVGVVLVGRPGGDGQHGQRHDRADEIHEGLERVGEQADRPGEQVGAGLQADGHDRRGDREPGVARSASSGPRDSAFIARKRSRPFGRWRRSSGPWAPSCQVADGITSLPPGGTAACPPNGLRAPRRCRLRFAAGVPILPSSWVACGCAVSVRFRQGHSLAVFAYSPPPCFEGPATVAIRPPGVIRPPSGPLGAIECSATGRA